MLESSLPNKKLISIVIPAYNEAENIPLIYQEVQTLRSRESSYRFEILIMDNHSTDSTLPVAMQLARSDSDVRVIRLSRNFGYQANILTGYFNAQGDAVVQLDADGEDDPLLISDFLRHWEAGNKVVYGVRTARKESYLMSFTRKIFYRLIAVLSKIPLPPDSGDFRLIDRCVLDSMREFPESSLYLRGLMSYIGFQQIGISYARRKRYGGESKFGLSDYVSLALQGITSFSQKPLYLVVQIGFLFSTLSFIGMIFYLTLFLMGYVQTPGFTTLVLLQLVLTGVQLTCLGINSIYVGRIFEEVKGRPRSVIEFSYPPDVKVWHA